MTFVTQQNKSCFISFVTPNPSASETVINSYEIQDFEVDTSPKNSIQNKKKHPHKNIFTSGGTP